MLLSNWLTSKIRVPTRIPENQKESLIGNIYLNFSDLQFNSGNLSEKILDHLPNSLIVEDLSALNKEKFEPQRTDLKHFDQERFLIELRGLRLEEKVNIIKDINDKYRFLHDSIMKVVNKHTPMKEISNKEAKRNKKLWITSAMRKRIKAKNSLQKPFWKIKTNFTIIFYYNINTTGTN